MSSAASAASSRLGVPGDAVGGLVPAAIFSPATGEEAAGVLRETARDGLKLVFAGGRTDIELGAPPIGLDAVVDSAAMSRVIEYAPADQIVVAESGVRLASLQATLASRNQRLALDPPRADRATVGGIVAANAFGPLRHRYGSVRDLLIGISFVRADGVEARGGGKVVKNVAGFDVPKLLTGSLGTLGFITTATFRLHPLPEANATLILPSRSPAQVRRLINDIRAAALEPAALVCLAFGRPDAMEVGIRVEGFEAGVAEQVERLVRLAGAGGTAVDVADESSGAAFWSRHESARVSGGLRIRLAAPASSVEAVAREGLAKLFAAVDRPSLVWYPSLGLGFFSGEPGDASAASVSLASSRRVFEGLGGSLTLAAAPAPVRAVVEAWGRPPASLPLMRSLKDRLDPAGRLAPGRFVGGI